MTGNQARDSKKFRIAAKYEALRREYFPNGGEGVMDANRLLLAAKHFLDAESARDLVVSQRATRCAEYLLAKIKSPEPRRDNRPSIDRYAAEVAAKAVS